MATYEYLCMACETRFEARRPIGAAVATELACPSCGAERIRRLYSFVASTPSGPEPSAGGCGCGGACACGRH